METIQLKTLEEIKIESVYKEISEGIWIYMGEKELFIHRDMYDYFGDMINVERMDDDDYTHFGHFWWWHESWFNTDFLEEDEFLL